MATFSSIHTQLEWTWRSLQLEWMYEITAFYLLSLFVRIQSLTSFNTASLLVRDAINDLLNIVLRLLSKVGIRGLGVRGVLTFDDRAGEVEVVMGLGFAVRVVLGEFKG